MENLSEKFCQSIMLYPQKSSKACALFAERVAARGFTSAVPAKYTKNTLIQGDYLHIPVSLHHPYDSDSQIVVSTVSYAGRNCVNTRLRVEAARDIQRLGHLGLGKHSYWELGHYEEYFYRYQSILDAGAAISSEQSGEMLHSRLQRVRDPRFKARAENPIFSQRLVDWMATYNYNMDWDRALRSNTENLKKIFRKWRLMTN
ncbi:hypothetical protein LOD99_10493 [Oopsacas minuta]|uniref:Uncharacterized protein n=1 Tax=Oopsacas minuta TaxID=111878 RepID=A0AAV7KFR2_9METZ|nr:hypothetical protein LOD99_10493 [Oopsacas minuta]